MHSTSESGLFESGKAPSEDELAAARMKIEDSVTTVVPCTAELYGDAPREYEGYTHHQTACDWIEHSLCTRGSFTPFYHLVV